MKLSAEPSFPPLPEEIRGAPRPKHLAFQEISRRLDEVEAKEGRDPTPEEAVELLRALEAYAKDELWQFRALAEQTGNIPRNDFALLRRAVVEGRLTARAGQDVEAFLHESETIREKAHVVLEQLLDIIGTLEQAEAVLAERQEKEIPLNAQADRRKWIKEEMDRWGYVGAA